MKTRNIALTLALCLVGAALCVAADNPNMGTWQLNEAKSKLAPGFAKNTTVVYAAAGDSVKVTTDGVDKDGKPIHGEWTGKFDRKYYPVTGDPSTDERSYGRVNDYQLTISNKKGGKVTTTGNIIVAADGKTRTLTVSGTDAAGKKVTSVAVYDKQ
jgi:hypothetical protein